MLRLVVPHDFLRRYSCPFRERSLPFLRHLENFWPVIESVSIKKKENRNPGSNPDLSYPNLSPLPLQYHNNRQRCEKF